MWHRATLVDARTETPRVRSLLLQVDDWEGHRAGQHADVRLTAEDGYSAQRSYSIASAPGDPVVGLTVERLDDGEVSPYLVDELRSGDAVELRGPVGGYFVWRDDDPSPMVLVGGGSGVVPLMAMLRHRASIDRPPHAVLLYSSRSAEDIIYRDELAALASRSDALRVVHTLTRSAPEGWDGLRGRIDRDTLAEVAFPPSARPVAYICGPTAFVEAVADNLTTLGHPPERVRTERFGPTGE
jgi:ferredoxin-NADP reductase